MKINLRIVLFLVSVPLIVSGPSALAHTDVTAEEARNLIDSTNDLVVVDVREPSEYCDTKGHISGALNYPFISGVFHAQYGELPIDGPVLVVCASGGRSNRAADFLDSEGFSMVYDMLGGMRAWTWETEPCDDPDSKYGGGTGEPNDPYLIYTAEQLNIVGAEPNDWDKHFKLMDDIDLSDYSYDRAVIAPDTNDVNDGFQGISFTGVFDGNGHTISHLTVQGQSHLGLFGKLYSTAMISNLGLEAVDVNGTGAYIGGLAGVNKLGPNHTGGNVTECYSMGAVSGDSHVGGLVGSNSGSISTSYSTGTVSGNWRIGGLVGINVVGSINTSYSTNVVIANSDVGGLVGGNVGFIYTSYSTGAVSGNEQVGGLVGANYGGGFVPSGIITNSYSTSTVSGIASVGGLVGSNTSSFFSCYSAGKVSGETEVGGLVGSNWSDWSGTIASSSWDIETSGQDASAVGTGKTTAQMQTAGTFLEAGWDFVGETENGTEDIWSICEGTNYPRFVWQIAAGDFVCPDGITIDDFAFFLEFWLDDNCDLSNDYCQGTDFDQSGTVDVNDLEILLENWSAER